ncbi:MAG: class A beta-lactamase-related serine hydrolase [Bacteroidia bacterium]|nr:class A beta-lactamase-related serine hydrolase [Bacteroidia bacterium]
MSKLTQIISLVLVAIVSIIIGYYLPKKDTKKTNSSTPVLAENFSTSLTNPVLPYYTQMGLDHSELNSFRDKLEKYIQKEKKSHPDLHVSYYFRDLNNGLWTGINERETFSPASLFKVPLMIALLKRSETDPKVWTMGVHYKKADLGDIPEESGFKKEEGKFYSIEDLLNQMIIHSDNAASLLLLQFLGDTAVMHVIDELNMHVGNGFHENTNFVTVKAYAGIFRILYNASFLNKEMSEKALNLLSQAKYDKGIRAGVPSNIKVAHKYGKRDENIGGGKLHNLQLHHFGLVYHPRKPFLIGVMTRGADVETKNRVIKELTEITYKEVDSQTKENSHHKVFAE